MSVCKVVVTGPESTGKTSISRGLAKYFNTLWIPEYAREYITGLARPYTYQDIEHIARVQLDREREYLERASRILFYDTHLIVTKVWFDVVYKRCPGWLSKSIKEYRPDLFLVCNTDLPWIPDPVRENGGKMREVLMDMYIKEINAIGVPFELVRGYGEERFEWLQKLSGAWNLFWLLKSKLLEEEMFPPATGLFILKAIRSCYTGPIFNCALPYVF
jgi:NadR type nicotinamide-nucleotide adenylyltransferase